VANTNASPRPASVSAPKSAGRRKPVPSAAGATSQGSTPAVPATNLKLPKRALAELRAATAKLGAAIDATNRAEAMLDRIDDADENSAYQKSTWWPSHERRERASKAFAEVAERCKVGVVVFGGRVFTGWWADASECEETMQECYVLKIDRVVVLG
jgi:hypothetical protein